MNRTAFSADPEAVRIEVRRLLLQATYGFLVTTRAGRPATRLCEHLGVDDDLTIWIGTSRSSRKVAEISECPDVVYATEDRADLGYAAVTGRASLDPSPDRTSQLWRDHLVRFFPAGPHGDDFVLLRIDVDHAETMSFGAGLHPDPLGLRSVQLTRDRDGWRCH